jgi:hypothetical protein
VLRREVDSDLDIRAAVTVTSRAYAEVEEAVLAVEQAKDLADGTADADEASLELEMAAAALADTRDAIAATLCDIEAIDADAG